MRINDEVIWTRGAVGLTGKVISYGPVDLLRVDTKHGPYYENPLNLICVKEANPELVKQWKEKQ